VLGKIAEQQGDRGSAVENYRKFLDLWKDADPGIPEVQDANQSLNKLKDLISWSIPRSRKKGATLGNVPPFYD
jgi:hypothetical protein